MVMVHIKELLVETREAEQGPTVYFVNNPLIRTMVGPADPTYDVLHHRLMVDRS